MVAEQERQASGADFAIVTNPKNPDQKVDLTKYQETDPVVLNQYNVQAHKKILHTTSYAPKDIQDWSPKEVGYSVAKKITNDGQYIGVGVDYNVEDKKGIVKLEYTWQGKSPIILEHLNSVLLWGFFILFRGKY